MILHWKPNKRREQGFTLGEVLVCFFIFTIVIAGLLMGYSQINRMAEFSSMSLAAQSFAGQGLEEARSVQFTYTGEVTTNAQPDDPFWVSTPPGVTNLTPEVDSLDVPTTGTPIYVTNFVSITMLTNLNPADPPLHQIRCDCVWAYPYSGQLCTNTAIELRAPDQ